MGKAIRKSFFRLALLVSVLLSVFTALCAAPAKTFDAWRTTIDKSAVERAHIAYTSNVVRCEWAGEDPRVASLMPANVAFNLAVIGDSNSASRVTKTLEETAEAIDPALRKALEQHGLLNSTLQWLVRSCRPGITNAVTYLNAPAHPAAFREQDFDVAKLKAAARSVTGKGLALPVCVKVEYLEGSIPLSKAEPSIDYPDAMPEETFALPFGAGIVLRAPERQRKFRLSASTFPTQGCATK